MVVLGLCVSPRTPWALPAAAPVAPAEAAALVPPPEAPAAKRTGRATREGGLFGASLVGAAGLVLGVLLCMAADGADDDVCTNATDTVGVVGGLTTMGVLAGGVFGALIGSAIPRAKLAGPWFSPGPIALIDLHVGATRVTGAANVEPASACFRTSLLARMGDHLALGPEIGFYPQDRAGSRTAINPEAAPRPGGIARAVLALGAAARLGRPLGALLPYVVGGAGIYIDHGGLVGSLGAGVEYHLGPRFGLGLEARVHGSGDPYPARSSRFLTGTAGLNWRW